MCRLTGVICSNNIEADKRTLGTSWESKREGDTRLSILMLLTCWRELSYLRLLKVLLNISCVEELLGPHFMIFENFIYT